MLRYLKLEVRLLFGILFFREDPGCDLQRASTIWSRLRPRCDREDKMTTASFIGSPWASLLACFCL